MSLTSLSMTEADGAVKAAALVEACVAWIAADDGAVSSVIRLGGVTGRHGREPF